MNDWLERYAERIKALAADWFTEQVKIETEILPTRGTLPATLVLMATYNGRLYSKSIDGRELVRYEGDFDNHIYRLFNELRHAIEVGDDDTIPKATD